jgi:hypothetical protein
VRFGVEPTEEKYIFRNVASDYKHKHVERLSKAAAHPSQNRTATVNAVPRQPELWSSYFLCDRYAPIDLTLHDLLFITPSKNRAQCSQDSSRITLQTEPLGLHTRATAAPIVLVWSSEVKIYSPEAPTYKTTTSFQQSTVQPVVNCMEQSPTGKANSSTASPDISSIVCSPRFITVLTTARHLSTPSVTPSHPYNLISFHLHLGLPSGLIPAGCSTTTLYTSHTCHMSRPSILLDFIIRILYYFASSTNLEAPH